MFGFNAHTLTRMPHMQALHVEFLPFALLAFDRLLVDPRARHAVSFAAWFVLQALASFYLLVITSVGFAAALAVRPEAWLGKRALKLAGCLVLAGLVSLVVLVPYLLPYWSLSHGGFKRPIEEVAGFVANWRDYLTTPGRLPRLFLANWMTGNGLYPGAAALALAMVAVVSGVALRDPRPRMCLAFGIVGVMLSFGPELPGTPGCIACSRRCRRSGPSHGLATLGSSPRRSSALTGSRRSADGPPTVAGGPARRSPSSRSSRSNHWRRRFITAIHGHPTHLQPPGPRTRRGRHRITAADAAWRVLQCAVHAEFHRALETNGERLQRVRAG